MIRVRLRDESVASYTDEEAWELVLALLAQIDIDKLGEPCEDAAQRVATIWEDALEAGSDEKLCFDLGTLGPSIVANAVDVLCEYARVVVNDEPLGSSVVELHDNVRSLFTIVDTVPPVAATTLSKAVGTAREGAGEVQTECSPQVAQVALPATAARRRLADERNSVVRKFTVGDHKGYLTVGFYPDGTPGEVFLRVNKMGSTLQGFCNSFAIVLSLALQHGVPLKAIVEKLRDVSFPPADNLTAFPEGAPSIVAFVARRLAKYLVSEK